MTMLPCFKCGGLNGLHQEWCLNKPNTPPVQDAGRENTNWKAAYWEKQKQLEQETRRTSDLSTLIRKMVEHLDHKGCKPGAWSRDCFSCAWVKLATDVMGAPINVPTTPPDIKAVREALCLNETVKAEVIAALREYGVDEPDGKLAWELLRRIEIAAGMDGGENG